MPRCETCDDEGYVWEYCKACNGSGEAGHDGSTCRGCRGEGEVKIKCKDCEVSDE